MQISNYRNKESQLQLKTLKPLILIEQGHMLRPYDPCNLMLNPSWIKFLISWGKTIIRDSKKDKNTR